ncbi:MFS transporter [Pseudolabrys sp. FHR47]|uniref:MFS transporter n=1 Tax=Pseudolabrys sp. FHR47 TaxID=2562284 RepID=UPI00143D0802|nr:MFS transporter [Pseudolabrys sp. FHR47]
MVYFLGWGFSAADRLLIAMLFPYVLPEFGLDFTMAGVLMAAMSIGYLVLAVGGGALSDKFGRKVVILPSVLVFSIGSALTGLATSVVQLIGWRTVVGAAEGSYNMAATAQIAEESPPDKRGMYVGFYTSAFPLFASFVAPLYGTMIAEAWGWRWACYLTIVPGLLLVPYIWLKIRERGHASTSASGVATSQANTGAGPSWVEVLKRRNVLISASISIFWMVWLWSWLSFGTLFLTKVKGYQPGSAGVLMAALGAGGFLGMTAMCALSDRIGRKPVVMMAAVVGLIGTLTAIYLPDGSMAITWAVLFVTSFVTWGMCPVILSVIPSESVPSNWVALGVAVVTCLAEFAGIIIAPPGLGALADHFGLLTSMTVAAFGMVPMFLISLALKETAPRLVSKALTVAP